MATKIKMTHPKAMLTLGFYTEYQNKILNEYKYENAIKPIFCFYEPKPGNNFLRFEDFSFDPSKNPQVTGKLYSIEGLLVHYATQDSYENLNNLDSVFKALKDSGRNCQFILFIYGDLKTFCFKFRFILLHKNGVEYKTSKVGKELGEDFQKKLNELAEKNKDKINEEFSYLLDDKTILLYDVNSEINTIPILIKNALYKFNSEKITSIILLKNIEKDLSFKNSLFLTIQNVLLTGFEKEIESIRLSVKELETNTVDLKGMFNPETIAENVGNWNQIITVEDLKTKYATATEGTMKMILNCTYGNYTPEYDYDGMGALNDINSGWEAQNNIKTICGISNGCEKDAYSAKIGTTFTVEFDVDTILNALTENSSIIILEVWNEKFTCESIELVYVKK